MSAAGQLQSPQVTQLLPFDNHCDHSCTHVPIGHWLLSALLFVVPLLSGTLAGLSVASAEGSSTSYSEGGYVPDFVAIVHRYNATGEPFRIEGTCKSACTIFLGIRNACVERSATLMFHGGHDIKENVTGPGMCASRTALFHYKAALRRYLLDRHYLDSAAYHSVPGSTLIDRFGYRECQSKSE